MPWRAFDMQPSSGSAASSSCRRQRGPLLRPPESWPQPKSGSGPAPVEHEEVHVSLPTAQLRAGERNPNCLPLLPVFWMTQAASSTVGTATPKPYLSVPLTLLEVSPRQVTSRHSTPRAPLPCQIQFLQALRTRQSLKHTSGAGQNQAGYSDLSLLASPCLVVLINTPGLGVAFSGSHIPITDAVMLPKICFLLMQLILDY